MSPLASDKLEGVRAIADFLGWEGKPGERRVYQARHRADGFPVRKREGIGIYAFKSELESWLKADETLKSDDHPFVAEGAAAADRAA